ncbi:FAD dependent oxidoreductase [Paraburkholderia piptadeniae]|uniref:FAD dependent oxidoreductase n=1 Tax=Paraburkholderia piptadeniae TaxID=1701573 RepID=A0A1N7S335_9BURK|nr:FAD-dependent oxidoreductase [Paraburkholderia piptadeniae]SIT41387.1 FAD dependent oxidoreductase [Paraburkholderia piptadeniae]
MNRHADVIVIGGGIMGTSTAFFLRRRMRSVILIERGQIGQQASGTNFGGVRRQGRSLPQLAIANRALDIWYRTRELLGEDVEFLPSGHTRVCYHAHDADYFHRYANEARAFGLHLEVLDGDAMFRRFPFLGREVLAASVSPLDGHANPRIASPAFARAAMRHGAQIVENTEIVSVEKDGAEFRVQSAAGETYRAARLVICAGAWASALSQQFGEPVPLTVRGPQMAVTEPVPYVFQSSMGVYTSIKEESVYFRQILRGNIVLGGGPPGPADAVTRKASVLPENTVQQMAQFRRLAPVLARLNVIRVWSGVESYLPDGEPVIGPSSRVDGLFYAFGFSGSGFQIGPGVGETLAELIDVGRTPMPLDTYSIDRFAAMPAIASAIAIGHDG